MNISKESITIRVKMNSMDNINSSPKRIKQDSITKPTYPGTLRRMSYFKMLEFSYFSKKGLSLQSFVLSQLRSQKRITMYNEWAGRGMLAVNKFGINIPDNFPRISLNEVIGDGVYNIDGFLPDNQTHVIDIGAQFGDYSLMCSKVFGAKSVESFEPLKKNTAVFKNLMEINNVLNVKLHEVALSDRTGSASVNFTGDMLSTNTSGENSQLVEFKLLDDFNLKCDLIKIDVEGFEMSVLRGGVETVIRNKPRIIMEVHSRKLRNLSINHLKTLGYRLAREEKYTFFNGNIGNIFLEPVS